MRYPALAMLACLALAGCGGSAPTPTVDVAPTQIRAVEMTQIAAIQATVVVLSFTPTALPPSPTTAQVATATLPTSTATRVPTARPTVPSTIAQSPAPVARVGERAVSGGLAFTIAEIRDDLPGGRSYGPPVGSRWLGMDVIIENVSTMPLNYNPFFSRLKTADNREYQPKYVNTDLAPELQPGTQQPGDTTRGWITFEIPQDAELATVTYTISGTNLRATISLR